MRASKQLSLAKAISEVGNSLRYIALPLGVLAIENEPKNLAFVEVLETLGFMSSGLLTTFFIDRVPKVKALVSADILSLLSTLGIAYALHLRSLPLLFAFSFGMTFIDTFYQSTLGAITADLNQSEDSSKNSLIRGFSNLQFYILIGSLVGSLGGSALISHFRPSMLILLDALTFLISSLWIFITILKNLPAQSHRPYEKGTTLGRFLAESWRELSEAVDYLQSRKRLRHHAISQSFVGFAYGLSSATSVSHFKITLGLSDRGVGLYQASNRVAGFLGAVLRVRTSVDPRRVLILGLSMMFFGYLGMGALPVLLAVFAFGVQQFGNSLVTPTNRALIMAETDSALRGRIENLRSVLIDVGVLTGNLVALSLLTIASTHVPFLVAAAGLGFAVYFNEIAFNRREET